MARRRIGRWLGLAVLVTGLALLAGQAWWLPGYVQGRLVRALQAAGVAEASLEVTQVGLWQTTLHKITLGPAPGITLESVVAHYSLWQLFRGRIRELEVAGGKLVLPVRGGRLEWGMLSRLRSQGGGESLPCAVVVLQPCDLVLDLDGMPVMASVSGRVEEQGGGYRLRLAGEWEEASLNVDGRMGFAPGAFAGRICGQEIPVHRVALFAQAWGMPELPAPTGHVSFSGDVAVDEEGLTARIRIHSDSLRAQAAGGGETVALTVHEPRLALEMDPQMAAGHVRAKVHVRSATISAGSACLELQAIAFAGDASLDGQVLGQGGFASGTARLGTVAVALGSSTLEAEGRRLGFRTTRAPDAELRLNARGWASWGAEEAPAGELQIELLQVDLAKIRKELEALEPATAAVDLTGFLSVNGRARLERGRFEQQGVVKIQEAGVRVRGKEVAVEGVNAEIALAQFKPLATAAAQRLEAKALRAGGFLATDGVLEFGWSQDRGLQIQRAECHWAGGRLFCGPVRLDLEAQEADVDLQAENLSLQEVLDWALPGRVKAAGRLYGHLPVAVRLLPAPHLTFGDGFVETRPAAGTLQLSAADSQLLLGVERVVPLEQAKDREEMARLMAAQALQNLRYDEFRCSFSNHPARGWVLSMHTRGQGLAGRTAIPVGQLDVTHENLDRFLNLMVLYPGKFQEIMRQKNQGREESRKREETVSRAIEQFF